MKLTQLASAATFSLLYGTTYCQTPGWVTNSVYLDGNSTKTTSPNSINRSWTSFFYFGIPLGLPGFSFPIDKWEADITSVGWKAIHVGNCTVSFRWEPGVDNLPKPTRALIEVASQVEAWSDNLGSVSVSTGLGSSVLEDLGTNWKFAKSWGRKIYLYNNQDPVHTLSGIQSAALGQVSNSYLASVKAILDFSIVSIPYPTLRPDTDWLPNYRSENGQQVQNLPDADGEYTLDVAADAIDDNGSWRWRGTMFLIHSQSVYGSPFRSWTCSSEVFSVSPPWLDLGDGYEELYKVWVGSGINANLETTTWTVNLTDRQDTANPSIPTKLKVKWHKPYENQVRISGPQQLWNQGVIREVEGSPAAPGNSIKLTWEFPDGEAYTVRQVGDRFEKIADLGLPVASIIAGWLGGGVDMFADVPRVSYIPNDALISGPVWSNPDSIHMPNANGERARYMMTNPVPWYESWRSIWRVESFGMNGFEGTQLIAGEKSSRLERFSAHFWFVGGGDDGGPPDFPGDPGNPGNGGGPVIPPGGGNPVLPPGGG